MSKWIVVVVAVIVVSACRPTARVSQPPAPQASLPSGLRLEARTVEASRDGVVMHFGLSTSDACRVASLATGTIAITAMSRDGRAVEPWFVSSSFDDGLTHVLVASFVPATSAVDLVVESMHGSHGQAIPSSTISPSGQVLTAMWPVDAAGTYTATAVYALPALPGLPADACRGYAAPVTVQFTVGGHASVGTPHTGLLVIPLALVIAVLAAGGRERRRRHGSAIALIGLLVWGARGEATIKGFGDADYNNALAKCLADFKKPPAGKDPGGDPSGIFKTADSSSRQVSVQPRPKSITINKTDCDKAWSSNGIGTDPIIYWDPNDTSAFRDGVPRDACAELYHELSHAAHCTNGTQDNSQCDSTGISVEDVRATTSENAYRLHESFSNPSIRPRSEHDGNPLPTNGLDACKNNKPGKPGPHGDDCSGDDCGTSNGDPHLTTFDGRHYDLQTVGEFAAVVSDPGFEIQTRQASFLGSTTVSVNTAIAMNVDGDTFGVYVRPAGIVAMRDRAVVRVGESLALPHGGVVEAYDADYGTGYRVRWHDGSTAWISPISAFGLRLDVRVAGSRRVAGLLGNHDRDPGNDLVVRGGAPLTSATSGFADSWRIDDAHSLFVYGPGETTATFTDRSMPHEAVTARDVAGHESAAAVCRASGITDPQTLDDCTLDVAVTHDVAFLDHAVRTQRHLARLPEHLSPGETRTGTLEDKGERRFTFDGTKGASVYLHSTVSDCWMHVHLFDPTGVEMGVYTGMCADRGRIDLPLDGRYTIAVRRDGGDQDRFGFVLTSIPPDRTSDIKLGSTTRGKLTAAGQHDRYVLDATAGESVLVKSLVKDCYLELQVYDPDGSPHGVYAGLCADPGTITLQQPGRYTFLIRGANDHVGAYGFSIQRAP